MSNFNRGTNYVVFGLGVLMATIIALGIIPGLDFLAWHILKPQGYWQGFGLLVIEGLTAWPRILLGFIIWAVISKIAAEVA